MLSSIHKTTKYKPGYPPGGGPSQPNIHGNDCWKVYKANGNGADEVLVRTGHIGFKNYNLIRDLPVYVDGVLMNGG